LNTPTHRAAATLFLACCAATAQAGMNKATMAIEHIDYSNGHGQRNIASVETSGSFGATTLVLRVEAGKRDYGEDVDFSGSRFHATAYHDWHPKLSTRTSAMLSTNDPVFVNRDIAHDFNLKIIPNTVLTIGGRHSEYYGGVDAAAWSAGASYYVSRLTVTYRYTGYHLSSGGDGHGNLLSFRLKDATGDGSTQLWLGRGTSVHAYEWLSELQDGKVKGASIRRVQPLTKKVSLDLSMGKTWYETPNDKFEGLSARIGVTISW
jgi:YaiO family outer membrane protein